MVGIVGFGKMGEAIAKGLRAKGFDLCTFDVAVERRKVAESLGISVLSSVVEVAEKSSFLFIAVKPQVFPDVARELAGRLGGCIAISIMAGINTDRLKSALGIDRVVRVMPNTPALVGEGAIAYSVSGAFEPQELEKVEELLGVLGMVVRVPEEYMDAVTGLSGSGPAYVFLFIEALEDAGVRMGLPRDIARSLALKTVKGSVLLMERRGGLPRDLINAVTSPGGTTIAALHTLERSGFKGIIMDAVEAATKRSRELGNG